MKRRRLVAAGMLLIALAALLIFYASDRPESARREDPDAFKRALEAAIDGGETFDLAAVAAFEWDRVHIFGPYTSLEEMERAVGMRWSMNSPLSGILRRTFVGKYPLDDDSLQKLVFVRGRDVVLDVTLFRSNLDMAYASGVYERGNAAFAIDRTKEFPTAVHAGAAGNGS